MPSFSRSGEFYGASLITGPSSTLVRVRFCPDHSGPPSVTVLAPDCRYGNPADADVAASVAAAVMQANEKFGTALIPAEVAYQSDNDGMCHLIRRCAYTIVRRIAEVGEEGFPGFV
ncbi:MAG: hypothetical protein AAFU85_14920 [Planctomycetota bacterium]